MSQVQQVPCDICGCYFPGRRIMLSHRARQHKEAPSLITHKDTLHAQYTLHTVDGMPTCKHCNTTFNRVDGLKKHSRGACPVLHGAGFVQVSVSEVEAQVPSPHGELRKGHECRVPPTEAMRPLLDDPEFTATCCRSWKSVFRHESLAKSLKTHCFLCAQWVSMKGPGAKQHVRLMHKLAQISISAPRRCCGPTDHPWPCSEQSLPVLRHSQPQPTRAPEPLSRALSISSLSVRFICSRSGPR